MKIFARSRTSVVKEMDCFWNVMPVRGKPVKINGDLRDS